MDNENLVFEKTWIQQRVNSVAETRKWMKQASDTMDKYNFDELYPLIVSLLRKSNTSIWDPIDVNTSESREYFEPVDPMFIEKELRNLNGELNSKKSNFDKEFIQTEIDYINQNYDPVKKVIKKIRPLTYNYTDFQLFGFFEKYVEGIYDLINQLPEDEKSLDDENLFKLYFANLFAHKINGCGITIENGQIKIEQKTIEYESS